jgi:hypothetical protein
MAPSSFDDKPDARTRANRQNRKKWKGHTPEGLERLRQAARERRPWERSTGPASAEGKAVSRKNALRHGGRAGKTLPPHVFEFIEGLTAAEAGEGALPDPVAARIALFTLMAVPTIDVQVRGASILAHYNKLIRNACRPT